MQSEKGDNTINSQERKTKDKQEPKTKDEVQQRKRRMITVQFCTSMEHKMMWLSVCKSARVSIYRRCEWCMN